MLAIEVTLVHGRYDAALGYPGEATPEWPPHPARVFMALTASASTDADFDALRWLERRAAPQIMACDLDAVQRVEERSFVVTNRSHQPSKKRTKGDDGDDTAGGGGGNAFHPGRTNGVRVRAGFAVREPSFALVWPDVTPPDGVRATLERLARATPYVGRSTSEARIRLIEAITPRTDWRTFRPAGLDAQGALLRTPYPGFVDALRTAYDVGQRAHFVTRDTVYVRDTPAPPDGAKLGPFSSELVVFAFERGIAPIDARMLVKTTTMFRKAVHERVAEKADSDADTPEERLPARVSGHGADGLAHVGYLALPDVGHRHARGTLLGVALALPHDMEADDRDALIEAVVRDEMRHLRLARAVEVPLHLDGGDASRSRDERRTVQPDRWTGAGRSSGSGGATEWVTATPLALDRFTRDSRNHEPLVRSAFVNAGYPEPAYVEVSPAPFLDGALHRPPLGLLPARRRRPLVHARVAFDEPLVGPVIVGSLRYLGLGLFAPLTRPSVPRGGAGYAGHGAASADDAAGRRNQGPGTSSGTGLLLAATP